jgi:hypothetical protein
MTPYTEEQAIKTKNMTLKEIAAAVIQLSGECVSCGHPFDLDDIQTYNHDGGIEVKGYDKRQWVYFHCKKCEYDSALWKIVQRIKNRRTRE